MVDGYDAGEVKEVTVSISNTETLSEIIHAGGTRICGVIVPSGWTGGDLELYMSPDGSGTDSIPVSEMGITKTVTVTAGSFEQFPPDFGYALRNIQLSSSSAVTRDETLVVYLRAV